MKEKEKILLKLQEDEIKKLRQELEQERNKVHNIKSQLEEIGAKESNIENKSQFICGLIILAIGITVVCLWGLGIINYTWIPGLLAIVVLGIGLAVIAGAVRSTVCWC